MRVIGRNIQPLAAHQCISARTTVQDIIANSAQQNIIANATVQRVLPAIAVENIGKVSTGDNVIASAARDPIGLARNPVECAIIAICTGDNIGRQRIDRARIEERKLLNRAARGRVAVRPPFLEGNLIRQAGECANRRARGFNPQHQILATIGRLELDIVDINPDSKLENIAPAVRHNRIRIGRAVTVKRPCFNVIACRCVPALAIEQHTIGGMRDRAIGVDNIAILPARTRNPHHIPFVGERINQRVLAIPPPELEHIIASTARDNIIARAA